MSTETLEDVFNETSEEENEEVETEDTQEETTTVETEEKGEEESDETPSSEKQDEPANNEGVIPIAAYFDERQKRQGLEAKLAEFEKQQEEAIDPVADPEGFRAQLLSQVKTMTQADRISMSRSLMIDAKEDYAEMEQVFLGMVEKDPSLATKMRDADNPAKFAYEQAQQHKTLEEIGDPVAFRERLRQEILAELKTEQKGEGPENSEEEEKPAKTTTSSLATKTASGSNSDDVETSPSNTIDDLF